VSIHHPGIVEVYECGTHQSQPYFAVEFCPQGSLASYLAGKTLAADDAAWIVQQIAHAIHAAHLAGITHRDLKPANVLLDEKEAPKVTDFGLAKKVEPGPGLSRSGPIRGTPPYMAPEQAQGRPDVGVPADVYALGAILYECLTGRPPFLAANVWDTIAQVVHDEPVPPRRLQPKTPRALEVICLKCLEKDPARRYASAQEVAEDLKRFLTREPIQARPPSLLARGWKWARLRPVVSSFLGASLAIVLILLVVGGWTIRDLDRARAKAKSDQRNSEAALRDADASRYALATALTQREIQAGNLRRAGDVLTGTATEMRGWEYGYLAQLLEDRKQDQARPAREQTLRDGQMCLSRDGELMASSFNSSDVTLWSVKDHRERMTLAGHTGKVRALCFNRAGIRLASAGDERIILTWNVQTGEPGPPLKGHTDAVLSVCFSPKGQRLLSGSKDGTVRLWDVAAGIELWKQAGTGGPVFSVCVSPDEKWLAWGRADGQVTLWDVGAATKAREWQAHAGAVTHLCFCEDSKQLASAGADSIKLWTLPGGKPGRSLPTPSVVTGLCFLPDGRRLASLGLDQTLRTWDVQTGAQLGRQPLDATAVWELSLSGEKEPRLLLALGRKDGVLKIWDGTLGEEIHCFKERGRQARSLCFGPDGLYLVSTNDDPARPRSRLLERKEGLVLRSLGELSEQVLSVAVRPDGKQLATAGKSLKLWDVAGGREPRTLPGHTDTVLSVCFSPDGKWLASGGKDGTVRVWDASTGKAVQTLTDHTDEVRSVGFSPDSKWLASGSKDGTIKVWDVVSNWAEKHSLPHGAEVFAVCFSPDSKTLASGGSNLMARLWDVASGKETGITFRSTSTIYSLCFHRDGSRLATGNREGLVQVWDTQTGLETLALKEHTGAVWSVGFSPDGRMLAAGGDGLKTWDAGPGR
jgi:WD40 repeat protein